MNGSKRKNRPTGLSRNACDNRQSKGKTVQAQGVYNNTYFMHAATALVGNLVQVHLRSGNVYEGVFRTFSTNFDIALELPFCIKTNLNSFDEGKPVPNCMIFTSDNVISIVAKEFDSNYATEGAFQTDNAISEKFVSRLDEKELEPWDPTGINGDVEFELDGGANGWDANEMFIKNEKAFGVQSTFDDSLSDYTVQIEKHETEEFKEAEAKAEKLAEEIEKNPACRVRLDLENGDEEALFAAVKRTQDYKSEENNVNTVINSNSTTQSRFQNENVNQGTYTNQHSLGTLQRSNNNTQEKFVQLPKRKAIQTNNKLVRPTSTSSALGNITQTNSNHTKLTNYQSIHMQGSSSFTISSVFPPAISGAASYRHSVPQTKSNGDVANIAIKSAQQRIVRSYATSCFVNPQQPPATKSLLPNHSQNCAATPPNVQEINNSPPLPNHMGQVGSAPPLPQRQMQSREDQTQDLRKFQLDFHLSGINSQTPQHQMPLNMNKPTNASALQMPQSMSPTQSQKTIQHSPHNSKPVRNQVLQTTSIHHLNSKPSDNSNNSHTAKSTQFPHPSQQQEKSIYQNSSQPILKRSSPVMSPGINVSDSGTLATQSNSNTNINSSMCSSFNNNTSKNNTELLKVEKSTTITAITKKAHVLNPSAKPFTPRSPSTPNPSRPHTPQTPVQAISGMYPTAPHVGSNQTSYYLMQPQQHSHSNAVQQTRLRRGPVTTSQMHVSAATATGQPLLTAAPIQQFIHYQQATHPPHFPSQSYQPVMRMFHEPPPQSIQFLAQTPPSTTPSPGQPHQQFHPPPQPSPAGGGPQPAYGTTAQPYHVVCPVLHPQLVPNYYHQGTQQNPHQQYQIIVPQHPAQ